LRFIIPIAIALIGMRIFSSQFFRSGKYGFVFDFGVYHEFIGSAVLVLSALLIWIAARGGGDTKHRSG
jgi:hypothetical protein